MKWIFILFFSVFIINFLYKNLFKNKKNNNYKLSNKKKQNKNNKKKK